MNEPTPVQATPAPDSSAADALLDLLQNQRRRRVLSAILGRPGPIPLDDLAADVAAREAGRPPADVPAEDRWNLRVTLHHVDLPKLDDAGVVSYDSDDHEVAATSGVHDAMPYLELEAQRASG